MNDLAKQLLENLYEQTVVQGKKWIDFPSVERENNPLEYDQKAIAYKHLEDLGLIDRMPMLRNVGYKINAYGVKELGK